MTFRRRLNTKQRKLCKFFATARVGLRRCNAPPEMGFAERYLPTLGGKRIRPTDMPEHGYELPGRARDAARKFKLSCREALA